MLKGDGTASVFYAVLAAIAVLALMVQFRPKAERPAIEKSVYSGIGDFMEVGILLALALTLGSLCKEMGTGHYIAGLASGNVPDVPDASDLLLCELSDLLCHRHLVRNIQHHGPAGRSCCTGHEYPAAADVRRMHFGRSVRGQYVAVL